MVAGLVSGARRREASDSNTEVWEWGLSRSRHRRDDSWQVTGEFPGKAVGIRRSWKRTTAASAERFGRSDRLKLCDNERCGRLVLAHDAIEVMAAGTPMKDAGANWEYSCAPACDALRMTAAGGISWVVGLRGWPRYNRWTGRKF